MDMLSYSKDREPALEETDLNAVVREVVELLAPRAKEWAWRCRPRWTRDPAEVPGRPGGRPPGAAQHRRQRPGRGRGRGASASGVTVTTLREPDGKWLRIEVTDNGPGMPPEKQAEIFRPFVSTKGARGTGLGLAVSRKILREHGGDILLKSQVGQGSTFTLRLPMRSPVTQEIYSTLVGAAAGDR